jgi:hypothetical protein
MVSGATDLADVFAGALNFSVVLSPMQTFLHCDRLTDNTVAGSTTNSAGGDGAGRGAVSSG